MWGSTVSDEPEGQLHWLPKAFNSFTLPTVNIDKITQFCRKVCFQHDAACAIIVTKELIILQYPKPKIKFFSQTLLALAIHSILFVY